MKNFMLSKSANKNKNVNQIKLVAYCLFALLLLFSIHVFAADLLKGTERNLVDTINGTGKTYLYIAELVIACLAWLQARSVKAFLGVLILSVGANIILKVGGII